MIRGSNSRHDDCSGLREDGSSGEEGVNSGNAAMPMVQMVMLVVKKMIFLFLKIMLNRISYFYFYK